MPSLHTLIALAAAVAPVIAAAGPCMDIGVVPYGNSMEATADITTALMNTEVFQEVSTAYLDGQNSLDLFYSHDAILVFMSGHPNGAFPDETFEGTQRRHGVAYQTFVDGGGGLVFTHGGIGEDIGPLGTFRDSYMPLSSPRGHCARGETVPDGELSSETPLFYNVENLSTNERTRRCCSDWSVPQGATVHAWWADGQPLVTSKNGVFAVNVHGQSDLVLISGSTRSYGYPADSDFPQLFANALYVSAGFDPSTACNGDYDDDGLRDEEEADLGTDFQRADTDADDVSDGIDNCPLQSNPDQQDTDNDGMGDVCDSDLDNDGVDNEADNCPADANATQDDADSNGVGDACEPADTEPDTDVETDADQDGVPDDDDNCPTDANSDQQDSNGDGVGDACESGSSINCAVVGSGSIPMFGMVFAALAVIRRRRRS